MMMFLRFLRILALLSVLALSSFGALASLEPTSTGGIHDGWLMGYAMVGMVIALLLAGEVRLGLSKLRRQQDGATGY